MEYQCPVALEYVHVRPLMVWFCGAVSTFSVTCVGIGAATLSVARLSELLTSVCVPVTVTVAVPLPEMEAEPDRVTDTVPFVVATVALIVSVPYPVIAPVPKPRLVADPLVTVMFEPVVCDFGLAGVAAVATPGSKHAATSVAMRANAKREHRGAPTRSADGASGRSRTENGIYKPKR